MANFWHRVTFFILKCIYGQKLNDIRTFLYHKPILILIHKTHFTKKVKDLNCPSMNLLQYSSCINKTFFGIKTLNALTHSSLRRCKKDKFATIDPMHVVSRSCILTNFVPYTCCCREEV